MNETTENDAQTEVNDTLLLQLREAQIEADRANKRLDNLKVQVQKLYFGSQIIPVGEVRATTNGNTISLLEAGKKSLKLQVLDLEENPTIQVMLTKVGGTTKTTFNEEYLRTQAARLKLSFDEIFCDKPKFNPTKVKGAWENNLITERVYKAAQITEPVAQSTSFKVEVQ